MSEQDANKNQKAMDGCRVRLKMSDPEQLAKLNIILHHSLKHPDAVDLSNGAENARIIENSPHIYVFVASSAKHGAFIASGSATPVAIMDKDGDPNPLKAYFDGCKPGSEYEASPIRTCPLAGRSTFIPLNVVDEDDREAMKNGLACVLEAEVGAANSNAAQSEDGQPRGGLIRFAVRKHEDGEDPIPYHEMVNEVKMPNGNSIAVVGAPQVETESQAETAIKATLSKVRSMISSGENIEKIIDEAKATLESHLGKPAAAAGGDADSNPTAFAA